MQIKRILAAVLVFAMIFSFTGCMNRNEDDPNSTPEVMEEDELVIYHNNTALSEGLMALTEEYSRITGKKVSSKLAQSNLLKEIESSGAAIYVVDTKSDLSGMHSGGFFADLMNDLGFSNVISGIPAGLQLNQTGLGSYGIPLMLEGYGYIFDKDMLSSLFGESAAELIRDLKTCSFTDFKSFCAAVDTYISAPSAAKVTVNGNEYTFAAEKTGKAASLTGVFALNYESPEAAKAILSTALAAKFASRYEVINAKEENVGELKNVLSAFVEALDLHTQNIAGTSGSISRGEEFAGGDYNYSTAVDLFTRGYALFYPGGTSDAADFEKSAEGFGANLDILPFKLPIGEDDITASGATKEKLDRSIVIGSRYYLAINPKASEELSAEAKDFISWLYEDEAGRTAYTSAFGGVPHSFGYSAQTQNSNSSGSMTESETGSSENGDSSGIQGKNRAGIEKRSTETSSDESPAEDSTGETAEGETEKNPAAETEFVPSHSISSSLLVSVGEYYASGNWIPDMSIALPEGWSEDVLGSGLSDFFGMETWAEADRNKFIDTLMGGWTDRLDKTDEENAG